VLWHVDLITVTFHKVRWWVTRLRCGGIF